MNRNLTYPTLSHTAVPRAASARGALLRDVLLVVGGAALIAACAQVEVPLKPVPLTLQTLGVLLVGAALGWRRGAAAALLYLLMGALGAPVFAGGSFGVTKILGPTGGYLLSYVPATALVGYLVERRGLDRTVWGAALAMLAGSVVIYACGLTWLAAVVPPLRDLPALLNAGLTPFVVGDAIKLAIAAALLPSAWALLGRR